MAPLCKECLSSFFNNLHGSLLWSLYIKNVCQVFLCLCKVSYVVCGLCVYVFYLYDFNLRIEFSDKHSYSTLTEQPFFICKLKCISINYTRLPASLSLSGKKNRSYNMHICLFETVPIICTFVCLKLG